MIPQSFIEELKMNCDIESVVSSYVQLRKRGRISTGLCPFHSEKTGSFTVYPESQSFYCFGCGAGGDVIGFIRRIENLEYVEAIKFLAQRAGMNVPEDAAEDKTALLKTKILEMNREAARFYFSELTKPSGKPALDYLLGRGLEPKTIKHFGLGYAPNEWTRLTDLLASKGFRYEDMVAAQLSRKSEKSGRYYDVFRDRVMFPIIDLRGNVIGFGGRKMSGDGPKYYNSPDTPVFKKTKNLFALNFAKKQKLERLILCEGYMDVISMHQAGFTEAVASLGTSLTSDQCRLASAYVDEAVLAYDSDEAGQKATKRAIGLLDEVGIRSKVLSIPDAKDPDEYIKKFGGARFKRLIEQSAGSVEYELSKIGAKYDTGTPEGKISALKDAVGLLAEMKNPLEREVWAAKLARDYGTTKEGILTQVQAKVKRRARAESARAINGTAQSNTFGGAVPEKLKNPASAAAEERLLGAVLRHPETLSTLSTVLSPEDFVCELYGNFYRKLLSTLSTGFEISLTLFGEDFTLEQQGIIAKLASLAREHQYSAEDAIEASKTILRLKEKKTDKEIGELSGAELAAYIEKMRKAKK
ncbi:MAG: DNA primase [Oscillospiraceae bacterium]|nr:DNA primase [Oscillospiraceae bacterium]MBR6657305.1 DNA primase [Oscillospiraceae bacterium]